MLLTSANKAARSRFVNHRGRPQKSQNLFHFAEQSDDLIGCLVVCLDPDTTGVDLSQTHLVRGAGLSETHSLNQVGLTQTHLLRPNVE